MMIPPVVKEGSPSIDVSKFTAPLREWQNLGAYDTAAACEKQRFETWMMLSGVAAETKETGVQTLATFMARVYRSSLCIASNDPRLR